MNLFSPPIDDGEKVAIALQLFVGKKKQFFFFFVLFFGADLEDAVVHLT